MKDIIKTTVIPFLMGVVSSSLFITHSSTWKYALPILIILIIYSFNKSYHS